LNSVFGPPSLALSMQRYRRHASGYDASARRGERWRTAAIETLALRAGETVLEPGCGTGLSFPCMADAVGPAGRVIGIESSTEMAAQAYRRISAHGLTNVSVIEGAVHQVPVPPWDALLLHYVHDILRDPRSVAAIMAMGRPGARVAVIGMRLPSPWALPLWPWILMRAWPYMTTFEGLREPWSHLLPYLDGWTCRTIKYGTGYFGFGRLKQGLRP